ncbi:hypothetical protein HN272_19585 [Acinetobacter baumannii]|uniref:hypothetical protein n=1 Tax=Acinetobacter baumannii TaxID=470 RepID=UPI00189AC06C|nr:hypothetical protein [Acinetobacter baumannii]MBF6776010.1 hypothetical protein [Acinetobacter baumannii]
MKSWSPQHYKIEGKKNKIDKEIIDSALEHAKRIRSKNNINPIFTLRHLSYLANVEYSFLRSIVYRDLEDYWDLEEPLYRYFQMALLHKDLKCKAPLIEPNLRRNLGKWST